MTRARILIPLLLLCACKGKPSPSKSVTQPAKAAPKAEQAPSDKGPLRKDGTIFAESTLMGTRVSINVYVGMAASLDTQKTAQDAMRKAFHEIARIESIASEWTPKSELSKLSASAGQGWQNLSEDLWQLVSRSVKVSEETKGLFDISFYGVGKLWSFKKGAQPPSPDKVKEALSQVGYRFIELDPAQKRVRLTRPKMALGMGAIAKGYGVDQAAASLMQAGFHNFIVEAGGDTYVAGTKGKASWRVGIQDPAGPGAIGALEVQDQAVVTSGNYERFFVHDGVHYTHILDPSTGYPIRREHSPRSVSIVASNATDADAYCTAVTVMGRKAGMAFVASRPELEAIIVDADGSLHLSAGLRSLYQPLNHP